MGTHPAEPLPSSWPWPGCSLPADSASPGTSVCQGSHPLQVPGSCPSFLSPLLKSIAVGGGRGPVPLLARSSSPRAGGGAYTGAMECGHVVLRPAGCTCSQHGAPRPALHTRCAGPTVASYLALLFALLGETPAFEGPDWPGKVGGAQGDTAPPPQESETWTLARFLMSGPGQSPPTPSLPGPWTGWLASRVPLSSDIL